MKPKPFLKWTGGKSKLLSRLDPLFPSKIKNYYEPFLGGGSVFFHLWDRIQCDSYLVDVNADLIDCYRVVLDYPDDLLEALQQLKVNHCKDYYYQTRSDFNENYFADNPVWRAAAFIYLNKTCFNGLYRENSKGQFNVAMGRYKNPVICDPQTIRSASLALKNAALLVYSISDTIKYLLPTAIPGDFVYFDPPYHPISATSKFTNYSAKGFNEAEQVAVAEAFKDLSARRVNAMVSNSDCEFIRDLYPGFNIHEVQRPGTVNSKAANRGKVTELVVTNY